MLTGFFCILGGFILGFILCAAMADNRQMEMCLECWAGREPVVAPKKQERHRLPQPKWWYRLPGKEKEFDVVEDVLGL